MKRTIVLALTVLCFISTQGQVLKWARSFEGTSGNIVGSIATDDTNNVYTAGYFTGTVDFDPGVAEYFMTSASQGHNAFFSKLDSVGDFEWVKVITGTGTVVIASLKLDSEGNIYLVGGFNLTADFDPGPNIFNKTAISNGDFFVSKLNNSGELLWVKSIGLDNVLGITGRGGSLVVDDNQNVYITGSFLETIDFDPDTGVYDLTASSPSDKRDVFVWKLDRHGDFVWAKSMGGNHHDDSNSMTLGENGVLYITGHFRSDTVDFDPSLNTFNIASNGEPDIFICAIDTSGNFHWAKTIGSSGRDYGYEIEKDGNGNIYLAGAFTDTVDFDPGFGVSNLISVEGSIDAFIMKLNPLGEFVWARPFLGASGETISDISIDENFNVYATGSFYDVVHFGSGVSSQSITSEDDQDFLILRLDSLGNLDWVSSFGVEEQGTNTDAGAGITINEKGDVFVTGVFSEIVDFDPSVNTYYLSSAGHFDIAILKYNNGNHISGKVTDTFGGCTSGNPLFGRTVQLDPGPYYSTTNDLGIFNFWVDTGSYQVSLIVPSYWEQECPSNGSSYAVNFADYNEVSDTLLFTSKVMDHVPDVQIGIGTAWQRRCFSDNSFVVDVCNMGTVSALDVEVELEFPQEIIPVYSSVSWSIGNNGEYLFSINSLQAEACTQIVVIDSVECTTPLNSISCVNASVEISPNQQDANLSNNSTSECATITASYDPNDKQVASVNFEQFGYLFEEDVTEVDTLTYRIRFQNTGNDTAFRVLVMDTLSSWLDPTTVVTEVASHDYEFSVTETGLLKWDFQNILLPDSFVNEPLSDGFIKYSVVARNPVPIGTEILNHAEIYFDYNMPIITNESVVRLVAITGESANVFSHDLSLYPNPSSGEINVITSMNGGNFQVHDISGKLLGSGSFNSQRFAVDLSSLVNGVYFLRLENGSDKYVGKIVKH